MHTRPEVQPGVDMTQTILLQGLCNHSLLAQEEPLVSRKARRVVEQVNINVDDFTLGELDEFEQETGLVVGRLDYQQLPIRAVAGFVWLTRKRTDPDYTFESVTKLKPTEFDVTYTPATEASVDPTEGDS